jgi:hypothetical protein
MAGGTTMTAYGSGFYYPYDSLYSVAGSYRTITARTDSTRLQWTSIAGTQGLKNYYYVNPDNKTTSIIGATYLYPPAATRTWTPVGASTDANNGANYSGGYPIQPGDSLSVGTGNAWTMTAPLSVASVISSGTVNMSTGGYKLTTSGRQYFNHTGTLTISDTSLITGNAQVYFGANVSIIGTNGRIKCYGAKDTISTLCTFTTPFANVLVARNLTDTCWIFATTTLNSNRWYSTGDVELNPSVTCQRILITPDTTYPIYVGTPGITSGCFRGMLITNPNALTKMYMPITTGGAWGNRMMGGLGGFIVQSLTSDTIVFPDSFNTLSTTLQPTGTNEKMVVKLHNYFSTFSSCSVSCPATDTVQINCGNATFLPTLLSTVGTIILNLDTGAIAKTSGPYTKLDSVVVSTFDIGQGAFYSSKIKCDKIRKNGGFIFTPDTAAPGTSIHIRVNGWFTATGNTAAFAGTTVAITRISADSGYLTLPTVSAGACAVIFKNGSSDSIYIASPAFTVLPGDTIPVITAISPAYGKAAGGRKSYVTHQHHLDSIWYGSTLGTISGDTATAPAHTMVHQADTVDVIVANSAGRATLSKGFTYANIYGLALTPTHGDTAGGTALTWIAYYGLQGGGASLGGVAVTSVVIADSAHGSGVAPKHAAGVVDFRAWNNAHDTATVSGAYQYTAGSTGRRHRGGFGLGNWLGF